MRVVILGLCLVFTTGCFRTHYENFSPENPNRTAHAGDPIKLDGEWRHFFLWGLVPSRLEIDARGQCGGADNIHSIQTRETFLQGLIAAVAGIYYVNIYSPFNGGVYCYAQPITTAPAPPPASVPDPTSAPAP